MSYHNFNIKCSLDDNIDSLNICSDDCLQALQVDMLKLIKLEVIIKGFDNID